jgi:maltose-binding protein MalE
MWAVASDPSPPSKPSRACKKSTKADHALQNDFALQHKGSAVQNEVRLTVFGPWLGPDQENVEAVLAYFAEATGADVKYVGSDSFEQQIVVDAEAGSAPNIAVFPQPGLAADMASRGFLTPLPMAPPTGSAKTTPPGSPGLISAPMQQGRQRQSLRLLLQGRCEVAGLVRAGELRGCRLRDP